MLERKKERIFNVSIFLFLLQCKFSLACNDSNCLVCSTISKCTACNTGYYVSVLNTCYKCPIDCTACTSAISCTSCRDGCYLSGTSCLICVLPCVTCSSISTCLTCQNGKYASGNKCLQCSRPCANCVGSSSNCTSCLDPINQILPTCACGADTKYLDSNYQCVNCVAPCLTCTSLQICKSCIYGYKLLYEQCLQCQPTEECFPCTLPCKQCNALYCLACNDQLQVLTQNCECQQGYYMDAQYLCQACSKPCSKCIDSPTKCLECFDIQQSLVNNSCICIDGFYMDNNYNCQQCSFPCLTCSNQAQCLSCASNFLISNYSCICSDGYFNNYQECQKCDVPCQTCQNTSSYCLTCKDVNQLVTSSNQCICMDGYLMMLDYTCQKCQIPCRTCIQNINQCQTCIDQNQRVIDNLCICIDGYYQDANSLCSPCLAPCQTCESTSTTCLTCIDVKQVINSQKQCECIDGFYMIGTICQACPQNCLTCDLNGCLKCKTQLEIILNYQCVCPQNYLSLNNQCIQCQLPCINCIDQPTICTECIAPLLLNQNKCICPQGMGFEQENDFNCHQCQDGCLECYQNYKLCTKCQNINQIQLNDSQCQCMEGYYLFNSQCYKCSPQCLNCLNKDDYCLQCIDLSYNFLNNMCYCADGYYQDTQFNCQICQFPCQTCLYNYDFCSTCVLDDQIIINNKCSCIDGLVLIDLKCKVCSLKYDNCILCNDLNCIQCDQGYYFDDVNQCSITKCGDSIVVGMEQCDDSNLIQLDGCYDCLCEIGWLQVQNGCQSICGDGLVVGNEQCDDGNNIQYDGCYQCQYDCNKTCENCLSGICSKCQLGYNLQGNDCISKCGDGILEKTTEECDDKNQNPRDGCFNCKLELGFICSYDQHQVFISCNRCSDDKCLSCSLINGLEKCQKCQQGYYLDSQGICQQCDKPCMECKETPKNCSIFNYDFYQTKECDSNLGQYYDYQKRDCISKCGDGVIYDKEQCDDSNIDDFDGCNNKCELEKGYLLNNQTKSLLVEPKFEVQLNKSIQNKYSLISNNSQEAINCSATSVEIEMLDQNQFNYTIFEANQSCDVSLTYFQTIETFNVIHIFIKYKEQFTKMRLLEEISNQEIIITPTRQVYVSQEQQQQGEAMAATSKALSSSIAFLAPTAILIGGFKFIWAILDILSWMNNFYFLNVNYPENVRLIFQQAEWGNIIDFPTINLFNQPSDDYYFESPLKFQEKGIDPLFFNNIQIVILFLLQVVIMKLLCDFTIKALKTCFSKKNRVRQQITIFQINQQTQEIEDTNNKKQEQTQYILNIPRILKHFYQDCKQYQEFFTFNLIKTIQLSFLDIILAISLQISNQQNSKFIIVLLNIVAAYIAIIILILLLKFSYNISKSHKLLLNHNCFNKKFSCFYEDVKIESKLSMLYSFINLVRKGIFIIATVFLYENPIFQTSLCFFSCFLNIFLLLKGNPFVNKEQYILNLIPDFGIFIIVGITVIFAFQDKYAWIDDQNIYILGWVIGISIYLSIILQLIFLLKFLLENSYEKIKDLIQFIRKQSQ